eukprot:EC785380.1.p1 GENE.EC785380.1~~EC785380.1.p1  ORF type:complete len:127 (+),score=15.68 EC785380.1:31-411(+)
MSKRARQIELDTEDHDESEPPLKRSKSDSSIPEVEKLLKRLEQCYANCKPHVRQPLLDRLLHASDPAIVSALEIDSQLAWVTIMQRCMLVAANMAPKAAERLTEYINRNPHPSGLVAGCALRVLLY